MPEHSDRLVTDLSDIALDDLRIAGGKATHLGELQRAGFPVPGGFVLTTSAYGIAARDAGVSPEDPEAAATRLRSSEVPRAVSEALIGAYHRWGPGRWRSAPPLRLKTCLA